MEHILQIGQSAPIKRRFFLRSWSITYAGMPSESVFSLVITWSLGYNSAGYNIFVPRDQSSLTIAGGTFLLRNVTPQQIEFQYQA